MAKNTIRNSNNTLNIVTRNVIHTLISRCTTEELTQMAMIDTYKAPFVVLQKYSTEDLTHTLRYIERRIRVVLTQEHSKDLLPILKDFFGYYHSYGWHITTWSHNIVKGVIGLPIFAIKKTLVIKNFAQLPDPATFIKKVKGYILNLEVYIRIIKKEIDSRSRPEVFKKKEKRVKFIF